MIRSRDPITLLYDARHGEYLPGADGVELRQFAAELEWYAPGMEPLTDELWESVSSREDDQERDWSTVIMLTGELAALREAFNSLASQCLVRPSGDDDTFDYWPSGMILLHAMAGDLDELYDSSEHRAFYARVYAAAVANEVPELDVKVPAP